MPRVKPFNRNFNMVRIVKITSIAKYIEINPKVKDALEAWVSLVKTLTWTKPQDIVDSFGAKAVDILGKPKDKPDTPSCERAVIDIKGNHIRIILKYQFHEKLKQSVIYIKWIGTHAEYSKLCKLNKQYTVEMFK